MKTWLRRMGLLVVGFPRRAGEASERRHEAET
jgi:hypothetical protein